MWKSPVDEKQEGRAPQPTRVSRTQRKLLGKQEGEVEPSKGGRVVGRN
jgi:hypothetical protein